jgi:hypothetical protein
MKTRRPRSRTCRSETAGWSPVEDDDQLEIDVEKDGWIPFNIMQTSDDTWEARDGEWKLVLTKTPRAQQTIDAK